MTDPSKYVFKPVWEDGEFTLSRNVRDGERSPLLAVAPALARPAPGTVTQLEHAYALRDELDPAWAVRPLALEHQHGRPTLLLEDPGGELLARLLGHPWEVTSFLRVAIGLAAALRGCHQQGLIHKDVKPANILVNAATGEVWLMGFGIASHLPRERQTPKPAEVIAGTLAYMAPEQTGRMNRSIDSRSDLYAYGVTLYEMLTGALPFTASDPMEWIHCHIARQPLPPGERVRGIPDPIAAIVLKLLSKTAEDRYQTAAGVESDLRRCLAQWESRARIDRFSLGTHDVPNRLMMPEKLYGREPEIATLLAAFDRVVSHGTPQLVLVSGYSGIGKSSVVNELHKVLVPPRGLFAAGKFDQYKRDIPYATLAQAFQSLVRQILGKSEAELNQWRDALREALGPNGQLIVTLIPETELIIGKQPAVPDLPPQDAQRRFQLVFRRFLAVFARSEHPLALFLDDLQWLDAATLELLEDLVTQPDVRYLMLVGAYRDNEVSSSHPLMRTLAAIRKAGASVQDIVLAPLRRDDVGQLIADSLYCTPEHARPLAQLVHDKTAGNPFFAIQFVTALAEEQLLAFDPGAGAWSWDLARIRAKGYTDNVVDLMVGKLSRLADTTQEALKQLACLGNTAEISALTMVRRESKEETHAALWEAVRVGLVLCSDSAYTFLHDRVQEAAYSLIPEGARATAHLRIGRLLLAGTEPESLEEKIFEIVNQLDRGALLIDSLEERERVAGLNLMAGTRAKASTAYASALTYLAAGRALLTDESWERRYELTFALEFHRAECEWLTADPGAEARLSMLSRRARNLVDIAAVACLRLTLYTTLDRSDRSVEVCLEYLERRGVHWSPHPTRDEVRQEYERIWSQLGSRTIEELVELPLMTDPEWRGTIDVLTQVVTPALFTDENLASLVICRMANISLEHGNSDGSCFAYVWLGIILGPRFGDYRAGFRFGRLGCDLVEKRGLDRFQARVYMSFGNLINPWTRHIRTGRTLVRRAFDTANRDGDLTFAAYSCNNLVTNLIGAGDPLGDVQREAESGLDFARKARFGLVTDIITGQLRLIRALRGLTPKFASFNDAEFNEDGFERHLEEDPRLALPACWYWIRKLQGRYLAEDYESAVEAASKAQRLLWTSPSLFEVAEYHFYGALARAALHDTASADERSQHRTALAAHHQQLAEWAQNCPENFDNRAALVAAEIARIAGRELDAERLYEQAIRSASDNGFVHNEGIANERAARFFLGRGFETIAKTYMGNARACYTRWGADGKVRQLDEAYPDFREEPAPLHATSTIGAPVEHLDLATVVKMSHAVSSEIVPAQLIHTLMVIAVEHAGAERGLLILPRGDQLRIEAEAVTSRDRVEVRLLETPATPAELPGSVLQYVIRAQESVILPDASAPNLFSPDDYIRRKHPRSVLCLPLLKQARLIGLLYLENNLTPHVFTPARIEVLKLLASQAAISLENAHLYADVRKTEAYLEAAQRLSHTGSFGWRPYGGEILWSDESYRITGYDRATKPTLELALQRIHPEDVAFVQQALERASRDARDFDFEYRYVMPDGSVKYLHAVAHAIRGEAAGLEFVGALMDVTASRRAQEELRRSETYLAEAQRLSHTGSWAWNLLRPDDSYGSAEAYRIVGLDPNNDPASHWLNAIRHRIHPEDAPRVEGLVQQAIRERTAFEADHRVVLPDGSIRYIHAVGHPVVSASGAVVELVGTVMDLTERKRAERALRRARERALEARFAAVLEERTRLARDMHDTLLQGFTGVALKLVAGLSRVTGPPESVAGLHDVVGLAQQTLADARRAVWDLRAPSQAGGDLPGTVRAAAEDCLRGTNLTLEYAVQGPPRSVVPDVEAVVVRVTQEAVANVVKHAAARTVRVRLSFGGRRVRLSVNDDGQGFAVEPNFHAYGGHWGLLGMQERASQIRGTFTVRSTPGQGTEIVLVVPYTSGRGSRATPGPRG